VPGIYIYVYTFVCECIMYLYMPGGGGFPAPSPRIVVCISKGACSVLSGVCLSPVVEESRCHSIQRSIPFVT